MIFVKHYIVNDFCSILCHKTVHKVGQNLWLNYNKYRITCEKLTNLKISNQNLWNKTNLNTKYALVFNQLIHNKISLNNRG